MKMKADQEMQSGKLVFNVGVVEADRTPREAIVYVEPKRTGVDLLMREWNIDQDQHALRKCLRRVFGELAAEAQLLLRRNRKLQVVVSNKAPFSVWAYFPMHRRRTILSYCEMGLAPGVRVLLLINPNIVDSQSQRQTCDELRDHLGHVLLYSRKPKARNECADAAREFERSKARRTLYTSLGERLFARHLNLPRTHQL